MNPAADPVAILEALSASMAPETLDEIWIFPPRLVGGAQSTVVVASAFERRADAVHGATGADAPGAEPGPGKPDGNVPSPTPPDAPGVASGDELPSDRRRILTARFVLERQGSTGPLLRQELTEHGAAPAERVSRVVDGVLRRLDDEPEPPRHARIGGRRERWAALLASLAGEIGR